MTKVVIAHWSKAGLFWSFGFLGGASLLILAQPLFLGGLDAAMTSSFGRLPWPLMALSAVVLCALLIASAVKMGTWSGPPVYLLEDQLHAEMLKSPVDMRGVKKIVVETFFWGSSLVLHHVDGKRSKMQVSFYEESASGIAAALAARFGITVEDPTIEPPRR